MIIGICGYGYSGASAVFDFLKGYEDISYSPDGMEFNIVHQPDGLNDLKYFLCINKERIACNAAINRFKRIVENGLWGRQMKRIGGRTFIELTEKYIESLIQIQWYGRSIFDPSDVSSKLSNQLLNNFYFRIERFLSRFSNRNFHAPSDKLRYFSIMNGEKFDFLTKQYLKSIIDMLGLNRQHVLLDMLFSATNPNMGNEFFDDVKTLVIDRDPRCMYLNVVNSRAKFMPYYNVYDFIKYYKMLKENERKYDNVLYVNYDKLIYEYETTATQIIDFLSFRNRPKNELKFFNPNISVKYTYPMNIGIEKNAIKIIEKELNEYLYDFPVYKTI